MQICRTIMEFLCLLIHYHISFSAFSSPAYKYFCSSYDYFVGCEHFCIFVKPTLTVFTLLFTSANMFFLFLCKTTVCVIVSVATAGGCGCSLFTDSCLKVLVSGLPRSAGSRRRSHLTTRRSPSEGWWEGSSHRDGDGGRTRAASGISFPSMSPRQIRASPVPQILSDNRKSFQRRRCWCLRVPHCLFKWIFNWKPFT